jgi:hypothetical protein
MTNRNKTMKRKERKAGRIIVYGVIVLALLASLVLWSIPKEAKAATVASQTFVLPSTDTVTHTANTYIILYDTATGNLVDDNGAIAAGNTWTGGDIATAVHAQNGLVWTATIPELSTAYEYGMAIFDAASPAKTDVPTMGPFLYDPVSNKTYTDTNPLRDNSVKTKASP